MRGNALSDLTLETCGGRRWVERLWMSTQWKGRGPFLPLRAVDLTRKAAPLRIVEMNIRDEPVTEQPFDLGT